jgi:chromosome segregation ATPase
MNPQEDPSTTISTPVTGVSVAQTPTSPAPSTPVAPTAPVSPSATDTTAYIQQMAQYELRVRDLQSKSDRAIEEANRVKAELEAVKTQNATILSGSADVARQALEKATQLEQRLQQEQARSLRAEALAAHPELVHYADLIAPTNNQEELNARIAALTAARERDIAAMQQATTTTPQNPNSRTVIPPANPARPNPTNVTGPSAQQMETELRTAMETALRNNDYAAFEQAVQAQIRAAGLNRE